MKRTCQQCGKRMNPVEVLLGPVCGECTLMNHSCFPLYRRRLPSGEVVYRTAPPSEQEVADEAHGQSP